MSRRTRRSPESLMPAASSSTSSCRDRMSAAQGADVVGARVDERLHAGVGGPQVG